ncbi:poly [ADP-ribose] polymerase tankyrase-2-like [Penaeus indicus]|uniref:poly [ADP-ribose] polymerase tankyrase-2-like n=1 Tax=Penaeus indicus TaxID=29960 RepID=UPI00300D48EC
MVLRHCTNSIFPLPVTRGRRDTARKLWTQAVKPAVAKEPPKPAVVQGEESPHGKRRSSLLGERRDSSHKVRRKQSNGKKPLEDLTVHMLRKSNVDNRRPPCSKQNSFEELPPLPPCSEQNGSRQSLPHSRRESREKNLRSRQGSVAELCKDSRRSSRERRGSSRLNSRRGSADRTHPGNRRGTKASFTENMLRKCLEAALDKCELEEMEVTDEELGKKGQPRYHDSLDKSLSRAVTRKNIEKVRELLENGANPNISTGHVPVLLRAARDGALYVVQALLRAGADVDARSEQGNSALHEAARVGHNEVVICLVYSNAHVDAINRNGVTPLQTALSYGQVEVVQTLIRFNADVYLKNKVGESALTIAEHLGYVGLTGSAAEVRRSSGPGTCAPVVQMEVPVSVQLILGLEEGCPLTVENCLSQGASCNTLVPLALHWPACATVLHRAAHHGDDLIARLLLQSGADVNARDVVGNTPLHAAAQAGHNRVVKLLLAHGAQLEATSRSGMTPLHRAASKGKELTCNLLLRRGANTQAEDSEGRTPADWATRRGFKSVARKLGHRRRSSSGLMAEQQHKAYIKYLDELYKASHLESSRASPSPEPEPA